MTDPTGPALQRILITGSRDWANPDAVFAALDQATNYGRIPTIVVHGACPTGADHHATQWVHAQANNPFAAPIREEPHPANWNQGRKAGPLRNQHMVNLGANLCLAFISNCTMPRCRRPDPHPSHGASGCAKLAEDAGIPTRRHHPGDHQ